MSISEQALAKTARPKHSDICPTCGQKKPHPRNAERHALFFVVLPQVFANWPPSYELFQPMSVEHLRKWLIYKAGWCTMRELAIEGPNKHVIMTALKFFTESGGQNVFFTTTAKSIREYRPRSTAYNKCKEADFKRIMDHSFDLIESIIGVPIEALKREATA